MTLSQAILSTLAYHDIFDYPLTESEIHQYLIGKRSSPSRLQKELTKLKAAAKIGERRSYFFLKNRPNLVAVRLRRAKYSQAKLKRAKFYSKLLSIIPTVQLIAISGALAMNNSQKGDDIDLVIFSAKNTLWTTRFLSSLILFPFKRKPQPSRLITNHYALTTNNKACLNLFLDESDLKIKPKNLYLAHEIAQMKPLLDRSGTYSRFIKANIWVKKYLPSWQPFPLRHSRVGENLNPKVSVVSSQMSIVEQALRSFQLWYMRPKITSEKIGVNQLFFHPANTGEWVMEEYQKRLKSFNIAD